MKVLWKITGLPVYNTPDSTPDSTPDNTPDNTPRSLGHQTNTCLEQKLIGNSV